MAQDTNAIHKANLSRSDKLALFATKRIGTMGFFFIIFLWTMGWLAWNLFAPQDLRFDPFPAFVFWVFVSNLIQLHLLPLILVGQNIQGKHSELRAQHDYETNLKAEKQIEEILKRLERLEKKNG